MMKMQISSKDQELLSTYLDGELPDRQRIRLEARLQNEPELKKVLTELYQTRRLLRTTPRLKTPRNFTLKPETVGLPKAAVSRNYFRFRMVSAIASFLLILVIVGDSLNYAGRIITSDVVPQFLTIQETQVGNLLPEAPAIEAQTEVTAAWEENPDEKVLTDELLKTAPTEERGRTYPPESETLSDEGADIVGSENELGVESDLEINQKGEDNRESEVAEESFPEVEEAPLLLAIPSSDTSSPESTQDTQGVVISTTVLGDETFESIKPEVGGKEEGQIMQEEVEQETEASDEVKMPTYQNRYIIKVFEIFLGLIAIGSGILALHFRKAS